MLPKKLQLWADLAHLGFSLSTEYFAHFQPQQLTQQIITRVFQSKSSTTTLPIYLVNLLISNSLDLKREKKINNVYHFENFCDKICLVILNDLPKKECFNLQNVLFFLLDKGFIHHHPKPFVIHGQIFPWEFHKKKWMMDCSKTFLINVETLQNSKKHT